MKINEDVYLIKSFLVETGDHFDYLLNNMKWIDELNILDSDDKVKIKRKMAYVFEKPVIYNYAKFWFQGEVWNPCLTYIKERVEEHTGKEFNSVLLNLYEDGRDEIKWHSDKEDTLGDNPVIACVNLGATRKFWFLNKDTGEKSFVEVADGDLLVMTEDCQENYLHAILKEKEVTTPRISLTFRYNFPE